MTSAVPELEPAGAGLRHYFAVLHRRLWIVLTVLVLCVAAAVVLSVLASPVYRAETKIVIGQGGGLVQPGFANSIQPYTATMSDLITSDIVARNVISSLGLKTSPHALLAKISTAINPQTAVLNVYVDDGDAAQAVRIDNAVATVFSRIVAERFGDSASTSGGTPPLTANVFDPAHALPGKVSPRPARNIGIAVILGLILGIVAAFLREHFDRGLRDREDVERAFALPVIGQVPFSSVGKERRTLAWDGRGDTAEAFRGLRTNLQYLAVRRPLRSVLVTSASPEQGKTTVAANLAIAIAGSGASTVVVDADLRRPRLETTFGVTTSGPGLTTVLVGATDLDDVIRELDLPHGGSREPGRLALVPSGPLPPNPSELLASSQMAAVLDRLAATFEYVIVDSPPVLLVADALELARNVDGVALVVRRGKATTEEASELRARIDRLGIHLVGAVLTDVEAPRSYGSYGDPAGSDPSPRRGRKRRAGSGGERRPQATSAPVGEPESEEVF